MDYRQKAYMLLRGRGVEIGALNAPARLAASVEVEYCDHVSKNRAQALFPELAASTLPEIDHVIDVDSEGLSKFGPESVDFVIANLVIDHLADPVGFVKEAFRIVKPGGHVVLSIPDANCLQGKTPASSEFESLLETHRCGARMVTDEQYRQTHVSARDGEPDPAMLRRARTRKEAVHCWDRSAFSDFLDKCMVMHGIDAERVYVRTGDETGFEYFVVLQLMTPVSVPGSVAATAGAEVRPAADSGSAAGESSEDCDIALVKTSGILLCGMHRSGTSLLARTLKETGAWLGDRDDEFLPAHAHDNPEGYWERLDVYDAHVAFMKSSGFDWDRLAGFSRVDTRSREAMELRRKLRTFVAEANRHDPWLLKDPRLSLLLPIWLEMAPEAVPVVAVRHPLEIAASLSRSHRGIYPNRFALVLWEKYLLRILKDLAGRPAVFVSYRQLMASPRKQVERIVMLLERAGVKGLVAPESDEFVNAALHRNRAASDMRGLLDHRQAELWARLEAACDSNGRVAIDVAHWLEPDEELSEFEESFEHRSMERLREVRGNADERLARIEQLNQTILSFFQNQNAELQRRNDELQKEQALLLRRIETKARAFDDISERLSEANASKASALSLVENLEKEKQELCGRLNEYDRSVSDLKRSISWRITAPLRWLAGLVRAPRLSYRIEHRLYRLYYGLPGLGYRRKRAIIMWLHRNFPWLTRSTQSFVLFEQQSARKPVGLPKPRMDAARAQVLIAGMERKPLFSIVMPVFNTDPKWLKAAIDSVKNQYYEGWELCIVDDRSTRPDALAFLDALDDPRIKCHHLDENRGIAGATNFALTLIAGDYIGLLDHDDVLTRDALLEVALCLQDPQVDLVYSDEDKTDVDDDCHGPVYKPDYAPDFLFANNYFCHFTVIKRTLMEEVGGFRAGFDGAQDFDLVLRLSEKAARIRHIPKVLYHWRMIPSSTASDASAKPYTWEAGRRALADSLARRGIIGRVDLGPFPNTYHVRRDLLADPKVSIIIPFRDEPQLLRTCVDSVFRRSTYANFELILVDNQSRLPETRTTIERLLSRDSRIRCIEYDHPFNYSAINNFAVEHATGEMLLFLNNDTEVISPDWIECLIEHAQRPEVGVVGCKLLYSDDTVQHGGVIVGIGSFAGHAHHLIPADHPGYMARPHLLQNVSAVTFACAMTRKSVYRELDGLNDKDLMVAYNDVDFCLRAREAGYLNVYTPHAVLYHYESKTRGGENDEAKKRRFAEETAYMYKRHGRVIENGDPYYNVNFPRDGNSFEIVPDYVLTLPV
jgi:GT2 family glycosyltransferase